MKRAADRAALFALSRSDRVAAWAASPSKASTAKTRSGACLRSGAGNCRGWRRWVALAR